MFTGGTKEKNEFEINMSDVTQLALLAAIEYCYTDDVRYMDDNICIDLLTTANKLWYIIYFLFIIYLKMCLFMFY